MPTNRVPNQSSYQPDKFPISWSSKNQEVAPGNLIQNRDEGGGGGKRMFIT